MGLVPFTSNKTPASYGAPSSPKSEGRMPTNMTEAALVNDSGPDPTKTMPAPPVDGALSRHDTNYPRSPKIKD
jgi:hypothetical protein